MNINTVEAGHQGSGSPPKSKIIVFLISFFVGYLGFDWFYLSEGNGAYICIGCLKLVTMGGLGVWYLVDLILILTGVLKDGKGQRLV